MKTIAFFVRHFTERGTEVAIYDYARYNEEILGNKSIIMCFTENHQQAIGFPTERISWNKFNSRFPIIELNKIDEVSKYISLHNIDFFYTLTYGGAGDIYNFDNKDIWKNCKTIKHCVFQTNAPEADFYIGISEHLNSRFNTNIPVIPHIVSLPEFDQNLRNKLNIPTDAVVIGRYGGIDEFNISIAHEAIKQTLDNDSTIYFLFMNTSEFYNHPRIIYLPKELDLIKKTEFINTCDAMIHAREIGETFGLSVAEFSIKNKPIITCTRGDLEHIKILGDKAILYKSTNDLIDILKNIKTIKDSRTDWNAYSYYSPENIMKLFNDTIFLQ